MGRRFSPGEYIGEGERYRILRTLGEGGMGRVYLAHDERLKRDVAIKMLLNSKHLDGSKRKRFQREAQIAGNLNHPNLVPVFDYSFSESFDMFVQEYVSGEDLDGLLDLGNLSEKDGRQLLSDLAASLQYLHEKGLVHRDIKPANILKDDNGPFRLMDFGLAYDPELTRMTAEGTLLGTLLFLPPEIALGEEATPASDIYQVGLVLHLAMTGLSLHEVPEDGGDVNVMLFAGLNRRETEKSLPKDIRQLIDACCQRDPGKRIQDGQELLDFIEKGPKKKTSSSFETTVSISPVKRKSSTNFLIAALVSLFVFGGAYALISVKSTTVGESQDLFSLATSRLLLPHKLVLTFPKGSLAQPKWHFLGESGQFERRARGLCLILQRPPGKDRGTLTINTASGQKSQQEIVFPQSPFKKEPSLLCGFQKFALTWRLHHEHPVDLEIGLAKNKKIIVKKRGVTGSCTVLVPVLKHNRDVYWFLKVGTEVIAAGEATMGLSVKYQMPRPEHLQLGDFQPIAGAVCLTDKLLLATRQNKVQVLDLILSQKGTRLRELWSNHIPPIIPFGLHIFATSRHDDYYFMQGDTKNSTLIYGTQNEHKKYDFEFDVKCAFIRELPDKRLICLFHATTNPNKVSLTILDKGIASVGGEIPGARAQGLFVRDGSVIAFVSSKKKLQAHFLSIGSKKIESTRTVSLGPRPKDYREKIYKIPEALVIKEVPRSKDIFLAYQDKGMLFKEDGGTAAINLRLPTDSHAKFAFTDDNDTMYLLALGKSIGITRGAKNQSRLYMVEIKWTKAGPLVKETKVPLPLVLTSVIRGRSYGRVVNDNTLFISSNSHFVVLERKSQRPLYKFFRYHSVFRYGMFFIGKTLLLPTTEGVVHGMDTFGEVAK